MIQEYGLLPRERAALHTEVGRRLAGSPAYRQMETPGRQAVQESLTQILGYLAAETEDGRPTVGQIAVVEAMRPLFEGSSSPKQSGDVNAPSDALASSASAAPQSAPSASSIGAAGRAGDAAGATLSAVDFPAFVSGLIQGTFNAIVDASLQQMEAYAHLLKNVSATVEHFARKDRGRKSRGDS